MPGLGLGRYTDGCVAHWDTGSGVRHREAAPGRQVAGMRSQFIAKLKRQGAPAGSSFEHGRDAVIREAIELVAEVLTRVVLGGGGQAPAVSQGDVGGPDFPPSRPS